MLDKLVKLGVKGKIYNIIQNILSENSLKLDNGIEKSKKAIKQEVGVIQGDPLSATLFLIYIKEIP